MRAADHNTAQWSMWIGRPLLGQWVYDVHRLLDVLSEPIGEEVGPVTVIGQGPAGVVALCAAAVDDKQRIAHVAAVGTLVSYISDVPYEGQRAGVMAPGIVRDVGDIPHLAGLALPRRVVIAGGVTGGGKPLTQGELRSAFRATTDIAQLANTSSAPVITEKIDEVASLLEAGQ
jgi:hypothetical protein